MNNKKHNIYTSFKLFCENSSNVSIENMDFLASGSEGDVYTDGKFAYKVTNEVSDINDIKKHIGKNYKNVVNTYDVWQQEDGSYVIKMELLQPITYQSEESKKIDAEMWEMQDQTIFLPDLLEIATEPEVIKIINSVINGAKELNADHLDLGFQNIMFDPKTNEYKIIDIN